MEKGDRARVIDEQRKKSRREYLPKRQADKIAELEADIADDEYLFKGEKLSRREREDIEYKRKIYELSRQHEDARNIENRQRYHIPDATKRDVQNERYVEIDLKVFSL